MIVSPEELRTLSVSELNQLAAEIREELCLLSDMRAVHFASNLGVVELSIALHSVFDFKKDRLIWDTGHQCYPHKILTGRADSLHSIRTKGGLMGFPNPSESEYDLFMTGHAGCSPSTVLGLTCGDELCGEKDERHSVAVIGDGAFASGIVFEAMNHIGGLKKNLTVILNDNKMSICPRVGGVSNYLDRLRMNPTYLGLKRSLHRLVNSLPFLSNRTESFLSNIKSAVKAGLLGGMLFEELGFRYIGPIDGHDIELLQKMLRLVRDYDEPVLLHVFTEKGRGYKPAEQDPTAYHAPTPEVKRNGSAPITAKPTVAQKNCAEENATKDSAEANSGVISKNIGLTPTGSEPNDGECEPNEPCSFTFWVREAVLRLMRKDEKICVITAAMCQGNMLEPIRNEFPERFFDVGICESHAVAFAAGLAKTGLKPFVLIYSTFMQRAYDQIFQEVSLQNLPVVLLLDRAGFAGPDGPTHHGLFDIAYMRSFPNMQL
ncbi:MAG: 1-deoxy-D-xylulose-5-phosphate synthase, partial [Thermoguttaceae bacterium]